MLALRIKTIINSLCFIFCQFINKGHIYVIPEGGGGGVRKLSSQYPS